MGMAEVAYQVQDFAQYLVASEGFVPTQGWPYRHLLDCLQNRVEQKEPLHPLAISHCIVDDYLRYYAEQGSANVSVDISSCDLTNLRAMKQGSEGNLRITLGDLSQTLCEHLNLNNGDALLVRDLLVLAHWRAQSFKDRAIQRPLGLQHRAQDGLRTLWPVPTNRNGLRQGRQERRSLSERWRRDERPSPRIPRRRLPTCSRPFRLFPVVRPGGQYA